jgi:hypothetical protein
VISSERLANRAYYSIIESIAFYQKQVVEIRALREAFGDRALPPHEAMRSHYGVLADAPDAVRRAETGHLAKLEELYEAAEAMEDLFKQKQDADLEALGRYYRERAQEDRKGKK